MQGGLFSAEDVDVITAIEPMRADPNLRRIRAGKKTLAKLRSSDIERLKIKPGMNWTATLQQQVQEAASRLKAYNDATRLLGKRALTRASLKSKLQDKGHDPDIIEQTLDDLASHGWLDDRAVAETLAHEIRTRKRGIVAPQLIRRTLIDQGVDDQTAHSIANRSADEADARGQAFDFARTQLRKLRQGTNRQTAARRIAAALMRRGFDENTVAEALDRIGLAVADA